MHSVSVSVYIIFLLIKATLTITYTCDVAAICGCSTSTTNVTGGNHNEEDAKNGAWSWMVSLQLDEKHHCAAVLISNQYAITSAKCVSDQSISITRWSILVGTNALNSQLNSIVQRRSILRINIHPQFDYQQNLNDIALIVFSPLTIGENSLLRVMCLPNDRDPITAGDTFVSVGWSKKQDTNTQPSNILQQITIQTISPTASSCQALTSNSPETKLCATRLQNDAGEI